MSDYQEGCNRNGKAYGILVCRELSLAFTKEAVFWAEKAIVIHGSKK